LAGCLGGNDTANEPRMSETKKNFQKEDFVEDAPASVEEKEKLATEFYKEVDNYYNNVRVFINKGGGIALEYETKSSSGDGLEKEINRVASLYIDIAKEQNKSATLSIIVDKVQAIVPGPSVSAYVSGDLEKNAAMETIEVIGIERRND